MSDDEEDEHASYTRRQISILRGRKIHELSPLEKLDFANAAPCPVPATSVVPERYRFNIDLEKIADADPLTKIDVANGAEEMGRIRQEMAGILAQLACETDSDARRSLEYRREQLSAKSRLVMARIAPYEKKTKK